MTTRQGENEEKESQRTEQERKKTRSWKMRKQSGNKHKLAERERVYLFGGVDCRWEKRVSEVMGREMRQ